MRVNILCSSMSSQLTLGSLFCSRVYCRKSVLNLNELGQMNGSAGGAAGGEDEELPAPHELGEELKFTGRYERSLPIVPTIILFF